MKIRYDNKQDASVIKLTELKQLSKVCKVTKLSQKLPEKKPINYLRPRTYNAGINQKHLKYLG